MLDTNWSPKKVVDEASCQATCCGSHRHHRRQAQKVQNEPDRLDIISRQQFIKFPNVIGYGGEVLAKAGTTFESTTWGRAFSHYCIQMGALPSARDYGYDHEVAEEEKKQPECCESGDHKSIQIVPKKMIVETGVDVRKFAGAPF